MPICSPAPGGERAPHPHDPAPGGSRRRLRDPVLHRRPAGRAHGRRRSTARSSRSCSRSTSATRPLSWAILRACFGRTGRARPRPPLPAPRRSRLAAQPAPSRAGAPVLRLPAAGSRRRPGRLSAFVARSTSTTSSLAAYLVYSCWVWRYSPADAHWTERLTIAATMYLLGIYLAFTGLVSERLRSRMQPGDAHRARAGRQPRAEDARARGAGARPRGGAPARRAGQRRQGAVPGDHQPRDPHADERRSRHHRAAARHAASTPASATSPRPRTSRPRRCSR